MRERTLQMYGGDRMTVLHDPLQELVYFKVFHPLAPSREPEQSFRRRVNCAADLEQLDQLLAYLQGVRDELAAKVEASAPDRSEGLA